VKPLGKKIVFTGGGSAGHVTVNMALIPAFQDKQWETVYIGSRSGIEAELIRKLDRVPYHGISTGKLRRYMNLENFKDPFRVLKGVIEAYRLIRKERPDVVFSKGGFVSVPVVFAAWLNRVPVVIHESDISPGLANKLALPFAKRVCLTFPETKSHLHGDKAELVGPVVRPELMRGDASKGYALCNFTKHKPVLLIMGGSLGSQKINEAVRRNLDALLNTYQIVHICGKGQLDPQFTQTGYRQVEYLQDELADVLAMTDLVVSRAGSNSIFEFLALRKPMLLIPLSAKQSRGDQLLNAESFRQSGYGIVLQEEGLNDESLLEAVNELAVRKQAIVETMARSGDEKAMHSLVRIIAEASK